MTTQQVARQLGLSYHNLYSLLRRGKVPRPGRDETWHYVWTAPDVERAKKAIAGLRGRK